MITAVEMAVVPGLAFLLGSLNGPVVIKMFGAAHVPISQGSYAEVMTLPTLVLCGMILVLNQLLLKPEEPLRPRANSRGRVSRRSARFSGPS